MQPLTKEQAVIISAYTGVLICKFSDLLEAIEDKLNITVYIHQLADSYMQQKIKEAFREDFTNLAPKE